MHGVGGRTVAEAQQRMSYAEFLRWCEFRRARGSLHPGMRIERAAALLASQQANLYRKQGSPVAPLIDFMPHADEPAISLDEAMDAWQ